MIVYEDIKEVMDNETLLIQGRENFVKTIKNHITKILLKERLYAKVKNVYDVLLNELYANLQLFK